VAFERLGNLRGTLIGGTYPSPPLVPLASSVFISFGFSSSAADSGTGGFVPSCGPSPFNQIVTGSAFRKYCPSRRAACCAASFLPARSLSAVFCGRKWKFLEARNSVLESHYVIADFPKILGTTIHDRSRLGGKQLT
jgi:hypothetical protein